MAKALVEVIGDSASAVRALEATSAAFDATGKSAAAAAGEVDAFGASMAKAGAARVETLVAQAASLKAYAASSDATGLEASYARTRAAKMETQAQKLLGIQAATTRTSLTQTAGTIGRGLTTYVTAPAAFIGYEAVKQALDFNQALLLIRTQAGASQAELEHMNQAVLQLVQSGHSYGQSAHDMAQGLYYIESEGIRGGRALAILQASAAGAAKGQTNLADTTNALTSAMKIWNVGAGGAAKTMATIDAITATGKMHLEDLNNAFQTKFFTTAKQLGIPLEQAGAALDVFTKAGVPAEVAANNMTTSFIKMLTPAKAAIPYLQQLGLNASSLGNALQEGGLTKALSELAAGYENLVQTQGKVAANKAILESFGGSRSGAPALALVQQQASYMQSLGEIQRLNNPATFWSQVSQAMDQPAMKIKQDVAEIGADFIKLGTALAPTVATLAGGAAKISAAFGSLPGPVKDAIGVVVGVLAVGGPVGLAVSGIGKLIDGLQTAFRLIGPAAATGAAEADAAVAGVGTAATTATGEVATLRAGLLSLGGSAVLGSLAALGLGLSEAFTPKKPAPAGSRDVHYGTGGTSFVGPNGDYFIRDPAGNIVDTGVKAKGGAGVPDYGRNDIGAGHGGRNVVDHPSGNRPTTHHTPPPLATFTLPVRYQLELAKAAAGKMSEQKAEADAANYILRMLRSGRLSQQAQVQAYQELASLQNKGVAAANKSVAAFKRSVTDDNLLAQARLDLANGELAAERSLLEKDRLRLQALLAEAQNSEERNVVLRQLAEVTRMLHTKSDQFALSPKLQEEIAKADALAALNPSSYGPDSEQIRLAKQAKAAALKAIHSHTLTLQGLTQAWQIVGQENAILAQAKGAIDTYHAVSSKAIVDSVKGLSQAQRLQLRERIAQEEAHRGYAPNRVGGHHHYHRVDVHVHSNDSHIVKVVKKHNRESHQRAGGRR